MGAKAPSPNMRSGDTMVQVQRKFAWKDTRLSSSFLQAVRGFLAWSTIPTANKPHQEALILGRVTDFCWVLISLTLGWIPVDVYWLGPSSPQIVIIRLLLACALTLIAKCSARLPARVRVHAFVWIQAVGYHFLQSAVGSLPFHAQQIGYGLFPFVLAAQLALFPMPWWRTALASLAPICLMWLMRGNAEGRVPEPAGSIWLLGLLIGLGVWTSHAQMRLLVNLLDARNSAAHDALTGLENRRAAELSLDLALKGKVEGQEPSTSVLLIDVDHFKQVNDRYGHAVGDEVLQALAATFGQEKRHGDTIARYGGEEFLLIMPGAQIDSASAVAERLRSAVESKSIRTQAGIVKVTVSIGAASSESGGFREALIARADSAMYLAKAEGRNCCKVAARS